MAEHAPSGQGAFPSSYDGGPAWGLLLHVDPGDGSTIREDWKSVLEQRRLLYACPWGADNSQHDVRRIGLALDTVATMLDQFPLDTNRVFISGLSGGGYIAMITSLMWPELFRGTISHAAQFQIARNSQASAASHIPYMNNAELARVERLHRRWVFVTGPNDKNHQRIKLVYPLRQQYGFDVNLFDFPGMGHELATGPQMEVILEWLERPAEKARATRSR